MNFKKTAAAAAILAVSAGAMASVTPHSAGMIGDTMDFTYYFPDLNSPYGNSSNGSFVVGNGVEVSNVADDQATLDVQAGKIEVDFDNSSGWSNATFNGWVLNSSTPGVFGSVTVDAATTLGGFSSSFISHTGDTLSVNWEGMSFNGGDKLVLDVSPSVPEAGNAAMMFAGLAVVAGLARRRRAK